ncbi:MAG: hypothetical protein IH820_12075 [Bacteroidetes bacterium]|nr:hypothetical protein [Bacteroidota bacterium]
MALKLIIIFVLLYFVARSVGNMVQAILQDPKAPPRVPPRPRQDREPQWQGPTKPTPRGDSDVEDARWVDLE